MSDPTKAVYDILRRNPEDREWVFVEVVCPHCGRRHRHALEIGEYEPHRVADCPTPGHGYMLVPSYAAQEWLAANT